MSKDLIPSFFQIFQVAPADRRQAPGEVLTRPLCGGRQDGSAAQRSQLRQRRGPAVGEATAPGAAASGGVDLPDLVIVMW